jgi:uncharacterized protein (DUF952 family)
MAMAEHIYHLASVEAWQQAQGVGAYKPTDFDTEGFIHCSYMHQLVAVANSKFRGREDLVLLVIDQAKLSCKVIEENLEGGAHLFPHIYGLLPVEAIAATIPFPCNAAGTFQLPSALGT